MIPHNYEHNISLHCINNAALTYHVPARLIISVLQVEHGRSGKIVQNSNGTYDIGPMAINSLWLPILKQHNIIEHDILFDPCQNVFVGTWILSKKISRGDTLLAGIGNYNSYNYYFNQKYRNHVRLNFTKISLLIA